MAEISEGAEGTKVPGSVFVQAQTPLKSKLDDIPVESEPPGLPQDYPIQKENLQEPFEQVYKPDEREAAFGGITATADVWKTDAQYPTLIHHKSITELLKEHFLDFNIPDMFPPPKGYIDLVSSSLFTSQGIYNTASLKTRFPYLKPADMVIAGGAMTRMGLEFDHTDSTVAKYNIAMAAELYRSNYTQRKMAALLKPYTDHLKYEKQGREIALKYSQVERERYSNAFKMHQEWQSLIGYMMNEFKKDANSPSSANNPPMVTFLKHLPLERIRADAVLKLDKFYLFVDELMDFEESSSYGINPIDTLGGKYYYTTNLTTHEITFKAQLLSFNRQSFNYFKKLADSRRKLRLVLSYDSIVRWLVIKKITEKYKYFAATPGSGGPAPQVAEYTINGFVIRPNQRPISNQDVLDDKSLQVDLTAQQVASLNRG